LPVSTSSTSPSRGRGAALLLLVVGSALIACASDDKKDRNQPPTGLNYLAVAAIDTLVENDTFFVGRVQSALRDSEGSTFVVDQFSRRIFVFASGGRPERVVGRTGSGPGEFQAPFALARWGDDTLVVTDLGNKSVSLFAERGRRFIRRSMVPGLTTSAAGSGRGLAVASFSVVDTMIAALWSPGDSGLRKSVPLPARAMAQPLAMSAFPISFVAARGDSLAVALDYMNEIFIATGEGALTSVVVPNVYRRSIPEQLDELIRPVFTAPERTTTIPSLEGLYWRPDGLILMWHKDWYAPQGGFRDSRGSITEQTLRAYVSVIDLARGRACPDLPIPTDWTENAMLFASGNGFYAIGHVVGSGPRPTLEVRRFQLAVDRCDWRPLGMPASAAR